MYKEAKDNLINDILFFNDYVQTLNKITFDWALLLIIGMVANALFIISYIEINIFSILCFCFLFLFFILFTNYRIKHNHLQVFAKDYFYCVLNNLVDKINKNKITIADAEDEFNKIKKAYNA